MTKSHTFDRAQVRFCKAQLKAEQLIEDAREEGLDKVDDALEAYLAAPSRGARDFADKLDALKDEYGRDWQPRHVEALLADAHVLRR